MFARLTSTLSLGSASRAVALPPGPPPLVRLTHEPAVPSGPVALYVVVEPQLRSWGFSESPPVGEDCGPIHFQITRLDSQWLIWLGCSHGGPFAFGTLHAAMGSSRFGVVCSTLIGAGPDNDGATMAKRLASRTGESIVISTYLPPAMIQPHVHAFAERRLLHEIALTCAAEGRAIPVLPGVRDTAAQAYNDV